MKTFIQNKLMEDYGINLPKGKYRIQIKNNIYQIYKIKDDSLGCILVGENKIKGQLIHSKYHSDLLDQKVANALANKEDVYITIK